MNSKAVIIQAFGMGNICTNNKKFMDLLAEGISKEKLIIVMTQCHQGEVNDIYETGRLLVDIGAVLAYDMTIECIFAKVSYLLGKKYSLSKVKQMLMTSLKGELTDIKKTDNFTLKNSQMVQAVAKILNIQD